MKPYLRIILFQGEQRVKKKRKSFQEHELVFWGLFMLPHNISDDLEEY